MVKVKEDMTGWKMWEHGVCDSRLVVIKQTDDYITPSGLYRARWECECTCVDRRTIIACADQIKSGVIKSCGCLKKEKCKKMGDNRKQYNSYVLYNSYGKGNYLNCNEDFLFSLQDFETIKNYCWFKDNNGYACARYGNSSIRLHQLIGCKNYDHQNRNKSDNRRENLRPASQSENRYNSSMRSDNNSGVTGVGFRNLTNKWRARIQFQGISVCLGEFDTRDDAIIARLQAEAKYYGDFAPQKHLFEEYGIMVNGDE